MLEDLLFVLVEAYKIKEDVVRVLAWIDLLRHMWTKGKEFKMPKILWS